MVFGGCNNEMKDSASDKFVLNNTECKRNSDCEMDLFKTTKFFLSFENQNCTDYITEKFWRSLAYDMIPIVLTPNKEYYSKIAPPDSFIHASDFDYDTVRLAEYLHKVSNDIDLFSKYFEWKREHEALYKDRILEQFRICELCYRLNTQNTMTYYPSISNWFNQQCKR